MAAAVSVDRAGSWSGGQLCRVISDPDPHRHARLLSHVRGSRGAAVPSRYSLYQRRRAAVWSLPAVPIRIRRARDVRAGGRRAGRVARPRSSAVVSGRDERAERGVLRRDSGGRVHAVDVLARGRGARRSARASVVEARVRGGERAERGVLRRDRDEVAVAEAQNKRAPSKRAAVVRYGARGARC